MRKNVLGRKFNRDTNERKALFKGLISSLVLHERITTTEPKAKAIKADVDKVITKVKKNGETARRFLGGLLNPQALEKLVNDVAPRFKSRNGGYTRIIRVGRRFGDNAMEVVMEFTEKPKAVATIADRSPRVASPARESQSKSKTKSRSLSERRQLSSSKKSSGSRRRSVAPRSDKRSSKKSK